MVFHFLHGICVDNAPMNDSIQLRLGGGDVARLGTPRHYQIQNEVSFVANYQYSIADFGLAGVTSWAFPVIFQSESNFI